MLKPASYPAQCFLADTQVRSDMTEWYPFNNVGCLPEQCFIPFRGRFKLGIDESFLQPDIVFFVSDSYQSFYFMVLVKKAC